MFTYTIIDTNKNITKSITIDAGKTLGELRVNNEVGSIIGDSLIKVKGDGALVDDTDLLPQRDAVMFVVLNKKSDAGN